MQSSSALVSVCVLGEGMALGMETESELTTLGGWLATRARSMKEARYGALAGETEAQKKDISGIT